MPDETRTRTVLVRALEIIRRRGWTVRFSNGPASPLNLRSAISAAVSELQKTPSEWHPMFCDTVLTLEKHLKDGVSSWEFGTHASPVRPRTQGEVEAMLTEVAARLEKK